MKELEANVKLPLRSLIEFPVNRTPVSWHFLLSWFNIPPDSREVLKMSTLTLKMTYCLKTLATNAELWFCFK